MVEEIQRQRTVFPTEDTPTRGPWQPGRNWEDNKTTDWRYEGRDPEGNIQSTWRTNRSGPEGTGGISWDDFYRNQGKDYWDEHGYFTGSPRQRTEFKSGPMSSDFFNEMYPTYDDQIMRGQRGRDYQNRLGTEWPSQGEFGGWESKSPVPYEAHRGTQWPPEGEFGGIGGLQAAVDPSDWRTILRILEAGGNPGTETAEMGGYGYNPAYAARGGLMSLRR